MEHSVHIPSILIRFGPIFSWYMVYIYHLSSPSHLFMLHGVHIPSILSILSFHGTWCTYTIYPIHPIFSWYMVYIYRFFMVHGVHISDNLSIPSIHGTWCTYMHISYPSLLLMVHGVHILSIPAIHGTWCKQLKYTIYVIHD